MIDRFSSRIMSEWASKIYSMESRTDIVDKIVQLPCKHNMIETVNAVPIWSFIKSSDVVVSMCIHYGTSVLIVVSTSLLYLSLNIILYLCHIVRRKTRSQANAKSSIYIFNFTWWNYVAFLSDLSYRAHTTQAPRSFSSCLRSKHLQINDNN